MVYILIVFIKEKNTFRLFDVVHVIVIIYLNNPHYFDSSDSYISLPLLSFLCSPDHLLIYVRYTTGAGYLFIHWNQTNF